MANKRINYTSEEDRIIKECINEYETYAQAFRKAAEKTGRSFRSIEQHYYQLKRRHVLALYNSSYETKPSAFSRFIAAVRGIFTF